MPWILLLVAGMFEIGFTTCMKLSEGFSRLGWSVAFALCAVLSFAFLALATRTIPLGIAYAVWTGLGAVGTIVIGRVLFRESLEPAQYVFLALILGGIVGVKLTSRDGVSSAAPSVAAALRSEGTPLTPPAERSPAPRQD